MEYFKVIGPVESHRNGTKTVKIELEMQASDFLCKAMALQVAKNDDEHGAEYEELQKQVIRAWEVFRP